MRRHIILTALLILTACGNAVTEDPAVTIATTFYEGSTKNQDEETTKKVEALVKMTYGKSLLELLTECTRDAIGQLDLKEQQELAQYVVISSKDKAEVTDEEKALIEEGEGRFMMPTMMVLQMLGEDCPPR